MAIVKILQNTRRSKTLVRKSLCIILGCWFLNGEFFRARWLYIIKIINLLKIELNLFFFVFKNVPGKQFKK